MNKSERETEQLSQWKGELGNGYNKRNIIKEEYVENAKIVFKRIIGNLKVESILEVGSNVGRNLLGIRRGFGDKIKLCAIEPNKKAFNEISSNNEINLEKAFNYDASNIPFPNNSIDLVFTCGLLIHIHPDDLKDVMSEIVRVSKRYVLCSEYFSHEPVTIEYRNQKNLLFKRDFGKYYLECFSNLRIVNYGFIWQEEFENFDNLNWFLFRKER